MNNSSEERLKIAVFVDFDNIAIGVKQSLGRNFDIGTVLEAIKEKGQVISKIAYGDWKRAEDYSRAMTQHAVQMVQRNLTPGGDKNGADIALALDALEMVFTRNHINAFVIVGGDSDFIALVEKLKQFDKTVFVVGGRAFTSVILQKNCHEFISYENLVGMHSSSRKSAGKAQVSITASLNNALPLIRRALKILSDREVSPQLGLLKSTLLQLDSTFSERDYGVSSFRDFIQKLSDAGHVNLKQVDRSLLVESKETEEESKGEVSEATAPLPEPAQEVLAAPEQPPAAAPASDATRILEEILRDSKAKPHWPMYLRTFKQFLRSLQPPFDERQYGLASTYDLVRQASRDGLLRVERNRQGILRIFPTERFPRGPQEPQADETIPVETETTEPEFEISTPKPQIQSSEPILQSEPPAVVTEILPVPDEPALQAETAAPVASEAAESPQSQRPKPKARKKTAPTKTAKSGKGETRKTKSTREKTKDSGASKAAAN
ncbi:MAG: NYN domain-containing protein [Acidobacteria bacterium]|nr:NYN domain-containing protein [Acidobacteriota bacterium]